MVFGPILRKYTHRPGGISYLWYGSMVNPDTGMLEYLYIPQTDAFVREEGRFGPR